MKKSSFDLTEYLTSRISVDQKTGCWNWIKSCGSHGYGNAYHEGKFILAHRLSYILFKGAIPPHYEVDHLCFNTLCVNPAHLEAVTRITNQIRKRARKKVTPCVNGHGIEHRYRDSNAKPVCRACKNEAQRRYKNRLNKIETN